MAEAPAIIEKELEKDPADPIILFSAETGQGKDLAWRTIMNAVH